MSTPIELAARPPDDRRPPVEVAVVALPFYPHALPDTVARVVDSDREPAAPGGGA